jgi:two-component system, LytTR family, sensor kinase
MQLDMKTRCEKCGSPVLPHDPAFICSYECTFCPVCASHAEHVCPHCGGELVRRPRRENLGTGASEAKAPGTKPWLIWAVSFCVWASVAVLGAVTISQLYRSTGGQTSFLQTLGLESSQVLPYAPLTPFVFSLAMRYPIRRDNWIQRCLLYLAFGLVFSALHVAMRGATPYAIWNPKTRAWYSAVWDYSNHRFKVQWPVFKNLFLANVVDDVSGAYLPIVLAAYLTSFYRKMMERERRTMRLESQLAKANLQVLKSQLQPHFLFNAMHSISALMHSDVSAADKMMSRLSDLLRMSLEHEGEQITSLSRELEFVNGYLEIEKLRFGDRLNVILNIAPDTLDAQTPYLLLQPLVENAVRHGIGRLTSGGEISLTSRSDGHNLQLIIRDNGPGFSPLTTASSGLGLRATQERLQTLYGPDQQLEVVSSAQSGTQVSVRIPFRQILDEQRT